MKRNIDPRLPENIGKEGLPTHASISSPWGKLYNTKETYDYNNRLHGMWTALFFEAERILMPDYDERCTIMCETNVVRGNAPWTQPGVEMSLPYYNIPPFMGGTCIFGCPGDHGDEMLEIAGRVNDFGTFRVEKECDTCPLDIVGSELGRCTTAMLQGIADGIGGLIPGPSLELSMVEAKCCGDAHCRIVAENRDVYPLDVEKRSMDRYGPVVTTDLIRDTPEEAMFTDPQMFREDCNYEYENPLAMSFNIGCALRDDLERIIWDNGILHVYNFFDECIKTGRLDKDEIDRVIRWVFEGAGKAMFTDQFAIKGLRDWLGVPNNINDQRVLGGYIEVILQTLMVKYEVEQFNDKEVILNIDREVIARHLPQLPGALVSMWYGMAKSLVGSMYAAWEEKAEDTPDATLRLKIGRKIDKRGS